MRRIGQDTVPLKDFVVETCLEEEKGKEKIGN